MPNFAPSLIRFALNASINRFPLITLVDDSEFCSRSFAKLALGHVHAK